MDKFLGGFKALFGWMKSHPWTAAIVFLVLVPVTFIGFFTMLGGKMQSLPVIGPLIAKTKVGA